jgi:tRNA(Ile)-lysidine synthase
VSARSRSLSLTHEALRRLFAHLDDAQAVLAAVSGGPDSIALMHLLARWNGDAGCRILVATVDHGLRPEAAAEAGWVGEQARRIGLTHQVLTWTGPKPGTGLQEAARIARYRLLTDCARQAGASHLVTAHTLDDQAETVLMRLSRGSGPAGLAGMRPVVTRSGILHVRPLLGIPKSALVELSREQGWAYVQDPSNEDDRFARVRWRRLLPALAAEGLTPERLARLAERARRVEEALDAKAREAYLRAGGSEGSGEGCAVTLRGAVLGEEPFEIAVRILGLAVARCRGEGGLEGGLPRLGRVEACAERLRQALATKTKVRSSLAGTLIRLDGEGCLCVTPEPQRHRGRYGSIRDDAAGAPHSLGKERSHA